MIPEFSIIIPTYNRIDALRHCFKHLAALNFSKNDFEVVLADDGSQDETKDLRSGNEFGFNLKVIHQPNAGTAAVPRNNAIKASSGRICLFVDDDVMVHPDLLLEHQKLHKTQPNLVVRGPVINIPKLPCPLDEEYTEGSHEHCCCAKLYERWTGRSFGLLRHFSMNYLCTSNASLQRYHLEAAGLFDPSFKRWEDAELAVRLKRLGLQRCWNSEAVVYHLKPEESIESRIKTAEKDGKSAAELYLRYPSFMMRLRSGLHCANDLRNKLFTQGPLESLIKQSVNNEGKNIFPKKFAENMLIERAYLDAGLKELKKS